MSSLEFREALPGDEAALLPMMRALAEQDPEVIPFNETSARAAFHQFLSLPLFGRIWLLYTDTVLIGYIILTVGFSFEFRGHDAFIDELYIALAHRRRGYGRQAMAFVEQEARKMASTLYISKSTPATILPSNSIAALATWITTAS